MLRKVLMTACLLIGSLNVGCDTVCGFLYPFPLVGCSSVAGGDSDRNQNEQGADNPVLINGQAFPPTTSVIAGAGGSIHIDLSGVRFPSGTPPFHVEILDTNGNKVFTGGPGILIVDWTPSGPGRFIIRLVDANGRWIQWTITIGGGNPSTNTPVTALTIGLVTPADGQTLAASSTPTDFTDFTVSVSGGQTPYHFVWHFYDGQVWPSDKPTVSRTLVTTGGQLRPNFVRVTSADGQVWDFPFGIRVN